MVEMIRRCPACGRRGRPTEHGCEPPRVEADVTMDEVRRMRESEVPAYAMVTRAEHAGLLLDIARRDAVIRELAAYVTAWLPTESAVEMTLTPKMSDEARDALAEARHRLAEIQARGGTG